MPRQALDMGRDRDLRDLHDTHPLSVQGVSELGALERYRPTDPEAEDAAADYDLEPQIDRRSAENGTARDSTGRDRGDNERERALRLQVFSARRLTEPRSEAALLPTGVATVDHLLGGGVGRGELIEVVGRRSSGRFALVLSALAAATRGGEAAALVDLGDQLDPQVAAEAGIELERLLWLRPQRGKQALGATELLLAAGFPLVVLDLGLPPVSGGRGVEGVWLRLARTALAHQAALLVATPYRACGSAALAVVEMLPNRPLWSGRQDAPRLLAGLQGLAELSKGRGRLIRAARQQERVAVGWWLRSGSVAVPTSPPAIDDRPSTELAPANSDSVAAKLLVHRQDPVARRETVTSRGAAHEQVRRAG